MEKHRQTISETRLVCLAHMHSWILLIMGTVVIQEIAEGVNKMKRLFLWFSQAPVAEAETPPRWQIAK
jgi:hypothetical protein